MSLKLKVKEAEAPEPIPVGMYQAKLTDIEKQEEGLYGDYVRLKFEIIEGDYKGVERKLICSFKLTKGKNRETNSKLFNTLTGLLGKEPEKDTEIELETLVGTECQIFVEDKEEKDGIVWQDVTKVLPARASK